MNCEQTLSVYQLVSTVLFIKILNLLMNKDFIVGSISEGCSVVGSYMHRLVAIHPS